VGNSIGSGDVRAAKMYSKLLIIVFVIITAIVVALFLIFRYEIASIFTELEEVRKLSADAMFFVAMNYVFDAAQMV